MSSLQLNRHNSVNRELQKGAADSFIFWPILASDVINHSLPSYLWSPPSPTPSPYHLHPHGSRDFIVSLQAATAHQSEAPFVLKQFAMLG